MENRTILKTILEPFVIVVAAAEAAVGLGIIILTARNRRSLNVERVDLLKL